MMMVFSDTTRGHSGKTLLAAVIVINVAVYSVLGARCRFSSTSDKQESCIFLCRCTDGCNTTTGDCLNGGQCEDGHPSGYRWSGPGCQIGNVVYGKTASQDTTLQWSSMFPANRAVDGNTDPHMANGHCAHPEAAWNSNAWWMVDLGDMYNISTVIIYNRDSEQTYLNTFVLSVGNTSVRTRHDGCASHHSSAGATVNVSCSVVGRYLSFRRDGGKRPDAAGLCEVVVIAHKRVSCAKCPSTSMCNDVIGCEACSPGKQQPDCVTDCEPGTYGKNCEEVCGHCKDIGQCESKNGHCMTACQPWYATDVCKEYIRKPLFELSDAPTIKDIMSSSVTVSWPMAKNITSGLEAHYYYVVWLQTGDGPFTEVSHVPQIPGQQRLHFSITRLTRNTIYTVFIEPCRLLGTRSESGTITRVAVFKSSRIDASSWSGMKTSVACKGVLTTWIVVGIASATFILGLSVATALLLILRKRLNVQTSDTREQKRDPTSIDLETVEHEYEQTTTVGEREDYGNAAVNVYDVIQN